VQSSAATTVNEVLGRAEQAIRDSTEARLYEPSDARVQARELLCKALERSLEPEDLDGVVEPARLRFFEALLQRRVAGEPIALIVGHTDFMGMRLLIRKGVFVPRPTSEQIARMTIARLRARRAPVHVDVATGIGPIALAVARSIPTATVLGLDIAPLPLQVGRENAERLGIGNVRFLESDLLAALPPDLAGTIDALTIHPPYFGHDQAALLPKQTREHEPEESLTDRSDDGLDLVRMLAREGPALLARRGWLLVQIRADRAGTVAQLLAGAGLKAVRTHPDSIGSGCVVAGRS
jgi:release factor glutamine methyltransferase